MKDYQGSMDYFQDQLTKAGITKDEIDMGNYVGLTSAELQSVVNYHISRKGKN